MDITTLPDLSSYEDAYLVLKNISWKTAYNAWIDVKIPEVGFRYFLKTIGLLTENFHIFLLILGIIWMTLYYKTIQRYSSFAVLSLLLILVESFNQSIFVLRQHLAMAIVFYSYRYIIEKDLKRFLLVIFVAFSMHQTAFVALPLYFMYHVKNRKSFILTIVVAAGAMVYSFSYVMNRMVGEMVSGYTSYIESDQGTNITGALIMALMLFFYCFFLKRDVLKEGINKLLFLSLAMGCILSFVGVGFNPTARLAMYYTSIAFLVIPKTMEYIPNRLVRNSFVSVVYIMFFYLSFLGSNSSYVSDYHF